MKTWVGISLLIWGSVVSALPCDNYQVASRARNLMSESSRFRSIVQNDMNYYSLGDEANFLASDANQLANMAQGGASCYALEQEFKRYLDYDFRRLQTEHNRLQNYYPNSYIRNAFRQVSYDMSAVYDALMGSGSQIFTTYLRCESHNYQYTQCYAPGQIVSAYVVQQLSSVSCQLGNTFGYQSNVLWVNRGCRANFSVTYRQ